MVDTMPEVGDDMGCRVEDLAVGDRVEFSLGEDDPIVGLRVSGYYNGTGRGVIGALLEKITFGLVSPEPLVYVGSNKAAVHLFDNLEGKRVYVMGNTAYLLKDVRDLRRIG